MLALLELWKQLPGKGLPYPLCEQGIRLLFLTSVQQLMNPDDLTAVCSSLYLLLCVVSYACVCITVNVHVYTSCEGKR